MAKIKLSKDAALKAINYSAETREQLATNANVLDNSVNSQFTGLQDPAFRQYLALSEKMQDMIRQMGDKLEAVSEYCRKVIKWIDEYNSI